MEIIYLEIYLHCYNKRPAGKCVKNLITPSDIRSLPGAALCTHTLPRSISAKPLSRSSHLLSFKGQFATYGLISYDIGY